LKLELICHATKVAATKVTAIINFYNKTAQSNLRTSRIAIYVANQLIAAAHSRSTYKYQVTFFLLLLGIKVLLI